MKNKTRKQIVATPAYPGENGFESWRRAYHIAHRRSLNDTDEAFNKRCARAYLKHLRDTGEFTPVDWRNTTFKDLMAEG